MRVSHTALYPLLQQPPGAQSQAASVDPALSHSSQPRVPKQPVERVIQGELLEKHSARSQQRGMDAALSSLFDSQAGLTLREPHTRDPAHESQRAIEQYQTTATTSVATRTTGSRLDLFV